LSRIADRWRECADRNSVQQFTGGDVEGLPEITDLLSGKANTAGTGWDRPPLSLLLYLEGSTVKFCFSSKAFPKQLWGSFASLKEGLLGVEQALCKEHCDWRIKAESKNGFTHVYK
jgi:hypothetical protein